MYLALSGLYHIMGKHCSKYRAPGSKNIGVAGKGASSDHQLDVTILARPEKMLGCTKEWIMVKRT